MLSHSRQVRSYSATDVDARLESEPESEVGEAGGRREEIEMEEEMEEEMVGGRSFGDLDGS